MILPSRVRRLLILPLSIWLAVLTSISGIAGARYLASARNPKVTAYVPTHDLPAFHRLLPEDIEPRVIPSDQLPGPAVRQDVLGRYTLVVASKGKPLRSDQLGPVVPAGALDGSVIVGMQAAHSVTLAGRLERGDVVDMLLAAKDPTEIVPAQLTLSSVLVLDILVEEQSANNDVVIVAVPLTQRRLLSAVSNPTVTFFERRAG
jgi:hypothetical protein